MTENRFTKTKFDAAQSVYVAEGTLLTAKYYCTGRTYRAEIQWKPGYERQQTSLTTLDEASMKSALLRLDRTVKFIGKVGPAPTPTKSVADEQNEMLEMLRTDPNTSDKAYLSACQMYKQKPKPRNAPAEVRTQEGRELSFADAKMLEDMRVTPSVSDTAYRNACVKMGVPPRPRPTKAVTPTTQTIVPFHVQGEAYGAFMQAHGELFGPQGTGIFAEQNAAVIANWMRDNSRQCDAASLDQCFSECSRLGYFRDARVLTRGMGNDFRVVRPYNHAEIVASRRQQVADATNQPPAGLSDVDLECWRAVHAAYPQLNVNSSAFKQCMRDTLQKWSREFALEQNPSFNATDSKGRLIHAGEWQAAADRVLAQWVRQGNPNLKLGGKGSRVWLD